MLNVARMLVGLFGVLTVMAILPASRVDAQCASGSKTSEETPGVQERKMVVSPDQVVMLNEVAGVLLFENDGLRVLIEPPPASQRMEAYREVDLREGDIIVMMNGKRFKSAGEANNFLKQLAVGDQIKLAVRRGEATHMVSFPKADPDELEGGQMMIKTASCGEGETMEVVGDLSLVLIGKDNQVRVEEILPGMPAPIPGMSLDKGDVISICNGTKVTSPAQFAELIAGLSVGDQINLTITRSDETVEMAFAKPEATEGARVIKKHGNQ
ncbi:MAG: PDZ domain-containing protein [Candidatus Zixiibacteriota bacterium]|nr:MAG: PDZ domain-containing protein [candidate division Zixibacteria bacterium]